MRRIAAGIGAGAMSLYRYVPSRDNLIELMADRVMGEIDVPRNSGRNIGEIAMRGIFIEVKEPRLRGSHPAPLGPSPGQPDRGQV